MQRGRRQGRKDEWSLLKDMIHGADVVVEVVDARDIEGTRLPLVEKWTGSKRLLMVANKLDLRDESAPALRLQNKGIAVSAKNGGESEKKKLVSSILARTDARPLRALLLGYPNVGKSSLINLMAGRRAAKVSPIAGTTRDIQWVRVDESLVVSDYRGVYPGREAREDLVRKGALNIQADAEKFSHKLAQRILASPVLRRWFEKRFDMDLGSAKDSEDVLVAIAKRKKLFIKGGEPNIDEASVQLIRAMKEAPKI